MLLEKPPAVAASVELASLCSTDCWLCQSVGRDGRLVDGGETGCVGENKHLAEGKDREGDRNIGLADGLGGGTEQ